MAILLNLFWMLFSFQGRLSRLGYIVGAVLSEGAIVAFFAALMPFTKHSHSTAVVWIISTECVLLVWTNVALMAKRLHDCGFSALWSVLCSPLCLLLFLFLYNYKDPLLLGAASVGSLLAIAFLTTFTDDRPNDYGAPNNAVFPSAYIGHTAIKKLSDKLEVLDRQRAEGRISEQQHADACRKLMDAHKTLIE